MNGTWDIPHPPTIVGSGKHSSRVESLMVKSPQERVAEVFGHFGVWVGNLPPDDPLRVTGMGVGDRITAIVGSLTTVFPDVTVNRLMRQVWHLLGSRTAFVAINDNFTTPTVAALGRWGDTSTVIILPTGWLESATDDPVMAGGALVFCGSQVVDAYNGRPVSTQRARAYEAEYLLAVKAASSEWVPNDYQKKVLAEFPEGVKSAKELMYVGKPVPISPPPPRGDC